MHLFILISVSFKNDNQGRRGGRRTPRGTPSKLEKSKLTEEKEPDEEKIAMDVDEDVVEILEGFNKHGEEKVMGNMQEEKDEKSDVVKAVEEAKYVILEKPKKNLDLFAVQPLMDLTGKVCLKSFRG